MVGIELSGRQQGESTRGIRFVAVFKARNVYSIHSKTGNVNKLPTSRTWHNANTIPTLIKQNLLYKKSAVVVSVRFHLKIWIDQNINKARPARQTATLRWGTDRTFSQTRDGIETCLLAIAKSVDGQDICFRLGWARLVARHRDYDSSSFHTSRIISALASSLWFHPKVSAHNIA